jgi:hypothetical protein
MYGSDTWVLTKFDIFTLRAFERKILGNISGPVTETGECRVRYNKQLHQLYRSPDIVISIRIDRLRWTRNVERMTDEDILKRIMDCKSQERRRTGRPKLRCIDGVLVDMKKLGIKNWWTIARDREAWKNVLQEAEAHTRLYSY